MITFTIGENDEWIGNQNDRDLRERGQFPCSFQMPVRKHIKEPWRLYLLDTHPQYWN